MFEWQKAKRSINSGDIADKRIVQFDGQEYNKERNSKESNLKFLYTLIFESMLKVQSRNPYSAFPQIWVYHGKALCGQTRQIPDTGDAQFSSFL